MFALWHHLCLCVQPAHWSARMILVMLCLVILTASWRVADRIPGLTHAWAPPGSVIEVGPVNAQVIDCLSNLR